MDAGALMPISDDQRDPERSDVSETEDRISNLPDTVIHHILSFVPVKYLLRTSILSTRWKYLWTSVPNLDFQDVIPCDYYTDDTSFIDIVNRVLLLRDISHIRSFRLLCWKECIATHINTWVSAAIKRKVEEIHLFVNIESQISLPCSLFSSESLEILYMDMNYFVLEPPTFIYIPRLKILYLHGVIFSGDNSADKFFSGCPALESVTVLENAWAELKTVNISVPSLKKLHIYYYHPREDEYYDCKVNISAAKLMSFKYEGALSFEYSLDNLSSVVDATVDVDTTLTAWLEIVASRACKLLRGLSGVQRLTLSNDTIQTLTHAGDMLPHLPTFSKLTYLELGQKFWNWSCRTLMVLLHNFPKLKSLVFPKGFELHVQSEANDWMSEPVPQCFKSSVKEVKIGKFCGMDFELDLVGFFLKNSEVLEEMTISFLEDASAEVEKQVTIKEQILMLPRGSSSSLIMFF